MRNGVYLGWKSAEVRFINRFNDEKFPLSATPCLIDISGENRKDAAKPELVRPLPWLLFLPSLVLLRAIRVTVNMGAFILGYPKITPSRMVRLPSRN